MRLLLAIATVMCASVALADVTYSPANGGEGQVNISGATLFADFFFAPGSTNDYSDWDGDGNSKLTNGAVDQLADWPTIGCSVTTFWLQQYRGVGSGNGLAELVDWELMGVLPDVNPTDDGYINHKLWFRTPNCQIIDSSCPECDPNDNTPCTPYCPTSIDIGVMDVPTTWFVTSPGTAHWTNNPADPGYGLCPIYSPQGQKNTLKSLARDGFGTLNTNTGSPDALTVFDTPIAWVPISIIGNAGTGIECLKVTDLHHLYLTGRMPNGENIVACTRDSGSGTRNGGMNSLGIDPSWGIGDNLGKKLEDKEVTWIGPQQQSTNCGGSSVMEEAVQNVRLAVGYTGLSGGSRAGADALAGKYEVLNVQFDDRGGTACVRPSVDAVLDNLDPNSGWQIGAPETMATVGNPADTDLMGGGAFPVTPTSAGLYINNIVDSIIGFEDPNNPGGIDPQALSNTPAESLVVQFFLLNGIDGLPSSDPSVLQAADPGEFNQALQDFMRQWNDTIVPAYGSINNGVGRIPIRQADPCWETDPNGNCISDPADMMYDDGSTDGKYHNYFIDTPGNPSIAGGSTLNLRNKLAGDFNNDGLRNYDDIPAMMAAIYNRVAYTTDSGYYGPYVENDGTHSTSANPVIPEIIGDFNGDGNFDAEDVRYFADGLAIDPMTGMLDRATGFYMVDDAWETLTGDDNFFDTTIGCAAGLTTYAKGMSKYDVAGNEAYPGAKPHGFDGVIDTNDWIYITANFGDWSNIEQAIEMDLSCDTNGDLTVDGNDFPGGLLLADITDGTTPGTPDGIVNLADLQLLLANYGTMTGATYFDGDMNCDGMVNLEDLQFLLSQYGKSL